MNDPQPQEKQPEDGKPKVPHVEAPLPPQQPEPSRPQPPRQPRR